jgi:FAD/FMN-containing dehydrogenase/Fe-S oxidoreductase
MKQKPIFENLRERLAGDIYTDQAMRVLYATDASSYRELPAAVVRPKNRNDIIELINFASENSLSVIPRGAGTSLAGQVVGSGIVADVSKYLNRIVEFNKEERWVVVEPGVNLAELNLFLAPHKLMFGPETSTANRCCLGGMLGNNSCGLHSIIYGSVRDHILEVETVLSDGSLAVFGELTKDEFRQKCHGSTLEAAIYRKINEVLGTSENREKIEEGYPDKRLTRRNNGYALDILADTDPFVSNGRKINISKLLAGSEGTLAFTVSMKLNLIPVPEKKIALLCAHFSSLHDALTANITALKYSPASIELIDDFILSCTKDNIEQAKNRFFIKGNPAVVLIIEFLEDTVEEIEKKATMLEKDLLAGGYGYHFPLIKDAEGMKRVWELRKAGLGVLLNIPGTKRSVQVIEDTAVHPELYPQYIEEFTDILEKYSLKCSYYGHIATGELHLSPLLDLKDPADIELYKTIALEIAVLVKKFRGSLSGEHGDGRLRGEFIPLMLGEEVYSMLKEIKQAFDPKNILNPGKIIDTPSITENLRYIAGSAFPYTDTVFTFPERDGILYAAEKCSGSGDCRKSHLIGGTMCPTFMATRDEENSTRGRANLLREYLTRSEKPNRFDHKELFRVMDLCISCKACKSECPSNVDMAKFKGEFLSHYYKTHGIPLRSLLVAWLPILNIPGMWFRPVTNFLVSNTLFKKILGIEQKRNLPLLGKTSLLSWQRKQDTEKRNGKRTVYLFADEFTNFNESELGIKCILLLEKLGYSVIIPRSAVSARTFLSKGLLKKARDIARKNILLLSDIVSPDNPLVGIEPSAILGFRDEYPEIAGDDLKEKALRLASCSFTVDEFLASETEQGRIDRSLFTDEIAEILYHGHCQQKAVASTASVITMLTLPQNYRVKEIASGCCGMAGAFGYEKEHYDLSMKIGELVLFPAIRDAAPETIISASGTSCRHQIFDGTGRRAIHPVEVLYNALKK